jgi:hypothetical protein
MSFLTDSKLKSGASEGSQIAEAPTCMCQLGDSANQKAASALDNRFMV